MRPWCYFCALAYLVLHASGCGQKERADTKARQPQASGIQLDQDAARSPTEAAEASSPARISSSATAAQAAGGADRKLIFRAEVNLALDDFTGFVERLDAVLTKFDAFVATSSLAGLPNEPRRGQWQIRVPIAGFKGLVRSIEQLGEVHRIQTSSDDVTEEFYDVEARIRNAQHEEARLVELLEDRTATLEAVLSVEREIARVRGDVERMQGRIRLLSGLSALSTIELRIDELRRYSPEQSPSFAVRLGRGFASSLAALVRLLEAFGVALAMAAPWLVFWGLPATTVALLLRRARRRRPATISG